MNYSKYLEELKGDELSLDGDHTRKAREFYAKFWANTLSGDVADYSGFDDKSRSDDILTYRGDTIISFNTIAGAMIRLLPEYFEKGLPPTGTLDCQERRLEIILNSNDVSDEIKEKFKTFYHTYHTLANCMPLVIDKEANLNNRKNQNWNDFPDMFFEAVKAFIYDYDWAHIKDLSKGNNPKYIRKFYNEKDENLMQWKKFVESNYLQSFFYDDDYSESIPLSPVIYDSKQGDNSSTKVSMILPFGIDAQKRAQLILNNDELKEKCKKYILTFLTNAINIIETRAKTLADNEG